jgi:hypothetical protein
MKKISIFLILAILTLGQSNRMNKELVGSVFIQEKYFIDWLFSFYVDIAIIFFY